MANYKVTDTELTGIANAIRTKGGTQAPLEFPIGFVNAIGNIPTGGEPVLQSKTVTQNGTVTPDQGYDGLSSVVVNVSGGSSSFVTPDFQGSRVYCIINLDGIFRSVSTRSRSLSFFHVQANRRYAIYSDINNAYLRIHFYSGKTYANDFQQYVTSPGSNEDIYTATNNITGTTEISGEGLHNVFYYTPDTDGEIVVLTNTNTTNVAAYCVEMP